MIYSRGPLAAFCISLAICAVIGLIGANSQNFSLLPDLQEKVCWFMFFGSVVGMMAALVWGCVSMSSVVEDYADGEDDNTPED